MTILRGLSFYNSRMRNGRFTMVGARLAVLSLAMAGLTFWGAGSTARAQIAEAGGIRVVMDRCIMVEHRRLGIG